MLTLYCYMKTEITKRYIPYDPMLLKIFVKKKCLLRKGLYFGKKTPGADA